MVDPLQCDELRDKAVDYALEELEAQRLNNYPNELPEDQRTEIECYRKRGGYTPLICTEHTSPAHTSVSVHRSLPARCLHSKRQRHGL